MPSPSRVSLIKQQLRAGGRLTDERGRDGQRPAHRAEPSRSVSVDRGYLRRSRTEAARLLNGDGPPALNGSSQPPTAAPAPAQPTGEPTRAGTEDGVVPPSSFVQARIERLYGPGALCCRFRRVVNLNRSLPSRPAPLQLTVETAPAEREQAPASPGLPVFRHLRPEFRQQLAVRGRARPPPADTSPTQTAVPPITAADPPLLGHSAAPQQKPGHRFLKVGRTTSLGD